ncbi:TenA family protein [Frankia sp. QA3]|uniref:TenA family protein n=1 Tax=Frankia sp. QA3 TaxID=710111 RepID=UPI000269C8F5|nr:TenA family protein [Frankia sp. QA3]EIV93719.1 putative transcription activator [Frankia sp. QA3]
MTTAGTPRPQFSARLWASTEHVYEAILRHPFLTGLTDGSLPRAAFGHFVVQDAHYLRDYARALAVCAAKAPTEGDVRALASDAAEAVAAEQAMHADLLDALGGPTPSGPTPAGPALGGPPPGGVAGEGGVAAVAPTTRAYTSYLLATVYGGSFLEGLAAVLPCYWIYARVGARLLADSSPDPVYARWIAAYGDPAFQAVADRVVALTDRVGASASSAERSRAAEHFVVTARYEWMFWDAAWRRETWPI